MSNVKAVAMAVLATVLTTGAGILAFEFAAGLVRGFKRGWDKEVGRGDEGDDGPDEPHGR